MLNFQVKVPLPDGDEITPANPLMEPRPAATRPKPKKGILYGTLNRSLYENTLGYINAPENVQDDIYSFSTYLQLQNYRYLKGGTG